MATRTVAYLTPLHFDESSCLGGGERYPLNLGRGVAAASRGRYRVELLSFGREALTREMAQGVTLRVLPVSHPPRDPLDVVSWDLTAALAGADLLHIHQAYNRGAELGLLLAKQQRKPVCVTDHGGHSSDLGIELRYLDLADRIVAYSDFGASRYRTRTPIVVIKGGVDAEVFSPPEVRPKRDRVTFVGRLLPHKGIDKLIDALPPELPLTVCGRPYKPSYFERLRQMARGKQVEFVVDADDARIRDLYARAWCNVLSSVHEDSDGVIHAQPELMGFTLLEAMACGTPAIAARTAAMPEFIREGETGFVYDDGAQLTAQLRRLANDPALVERMGLKGREVVMTEFDLHIAGAKLAAVYDELLAARTGAAA